MSELRVPARGTIEIRGNRLFAHISWIAGTTHVSTVYRTLIQVAQEAGLTLLEIEGTPLGTWGQSFFERFPSVRRGDASRHVFPVPARRRP
jgi:hypothetical protein